MALPRASGASFNGWSSMAWAYLALRIFSFCVTYLLCKSNEGWKDNFILISKYPLPRFGVWLVILYRIHVKSPSVNAPTHSTRFGWGWTSVFPVVRFNSQTGEYKCWTNSDVDLGCCYGESYGEREPSGRGPWQWKKLTAVRFHFGVAGSRDLHSKFQFSSKREQLRNPESGQSQS